MRWKVKRSAVMRKGLVCPVLCKFTGSSGLNPQSEVRQPDTHLFSPAFIYLLSFFDSAVSLSISVCVCLFLLAAFFTLTQAWIIQNDWANSPDVSIITYVFPLVSFLLIHFSCFLYRCFFWGDSVIIVSWPPHIVPSYLSDLWVSTWWAVLHFLICLSSDSFSRPTHLWTPTPALCRHSETQEWKINRYKLQTYLFRTLKHCLMSENNKGIFHLKNEHFVTIYSLMSFQTCISFFLMLNTKEDILKNRRVVGPYWLP